MTSLMHDFPSENADGFVGLRYYAPPTDLADYVGTAYLFTAIREQVSDITRADMGQVRFMLSGGPGDYQFATGAVAATPDICLIGPTSGATRFCVAGPVQVFGFSLLPLGWQAFIDHDASNCADGIADLAQRRPDMVPLFHDLRRLNDPQAALDLLWDRLRQMKKAEVSCVDRHFVEAADAWLADERSPRVELLLAQTGLSSRQAARLANRLYGAPPKYLARKYRALRCAAQIAIDHRSWQEMCGDGTFYDQSHLIREIKHFIGITPTQLRTEPTLVHRLSLPQRRSLPKPVSEISLIS